MFDDEGDSSNDKRRFSDHSSFASIVSTTTNGGWMGISRASSVGSVNAVSCSSASSSHNTDDEEDVTMTVSRLKAKREAHTHAEQVRRDAIKKAYEELQAVNPMTSSNPPSVKISKAIILQKSLNYIQYSDQQHLKDQEVLEALHKEVTALHIIKKSYENMVKNCKDHLPSDQLSNHHKFYVFQRLIESLFAPFDASVDTSSFEQISNCLFAWLENHCKPTILKDLVDDILSSIDHKQPPSFS